VEFRFGDVFDTDVIMNQLARLTAEDRDNLTAYLDGELDENATRRIESILTSSEVARTDVEVLARTYELLDLLPRPASGKEFTEKTIATAKQEEYREPITHQAWFRYVEQSLPLIGWSFAVFLAACCGFAITHQWVPQQEDLLLEELPLIQNLDQYSEIGSVQFLEALASQKQLLEDIQGASQK